MILGEDEQIYLVDFGAVQDTAAKEGGTFTVVGTYGYTPIEQFGGRAVPASDLYALGATLIHLLTGIAPADLPQKDFQIHFKGKVSISSNLVHWIEKITEPILEKRFSTVKQAIAVLKDPTLSISNSSLSAEKLQNKKIIFPHSDRIDLKKSLDSLCIDIVPIISFSRISKLEKSTVLSLLSNIVSNFFTIPIFVAVMFLLIPLLIIFASYPSLSFLSSFIWVIAACCSITLVEYFTCTLLGQASIVFNSNSFEIKEHIFGITYSNNKDITSRIEDISFQCDESRKQRSIAVSVLNPENKKLKRFYLGSTLSETELIWLAQELREWLQLQKQQAQKP